MPDDPGRSRRIFRSVSPRIPLNEHAQLLIGDDAIYDVLLVDTSSEGFRLRCDRMIRGTLAPATLRVNRYGDFRVEIKWTRAYEVGGIFLDAAPELE